MQDLAGGRHRLLLRARRCRGRPARSKTAKAVALLGRERSPLFPDIASSQEQGLPGVDTYFWSAFFYPKDTPDPIVQEAEEVTSDALDTPAIAERLKKSVVPVSAANAARRSI